MAKERRNIGNPKNAGRKPGWFREWCDRALKSEIFLKKLEKALKSDDFDTWFPVFKEIQPIAHGKPAQDLHHKFEQKKRLVIIMDGDDDKDNGDQD